MTVAQLIKKFPACSGIHPASYPIGIGGSFLGSKAAGAWSWIFTSN